MLRFRVWFKRVSLCFYAKRGSWKLWTLAYVCMLMIFSIFGDRGLWQSHQLWQRTKRVEIENHLLLNEVRSLGQQVYLFKNDLRTIEKHVREELNLVGHNEIQFVFKD